MLCCVPQHFLPLRRSPTFANISMLKIHTGKRRLPDRVLIQGAKGPSPESSLPPLSSLHTHALPAVSSVSTATQESPCLFTPNTAQSILCPPASRELGTSPKGTSPYWDEVEARSQVLHLYPCYADLSMFVQVDQTDVPKSHLP